ncbi:MAG: polymerase-associated protein RapA [Chloroflexota bacterium]
MSEILHGAWLPQRGLFVWGETDEPPPRRGRRPKVPAHPFHLPAAALRALLNLPEAEDTAVALWLPSSDDAPHPSPELVAAGVEAPATQPKRLAAWQVSGLLLSPAPALDLLLGDGLSAAPSADMRAWRVAALLAMELLARQQMMPGLRRDGFRLLAAWLPRPAPELSARLTALAEAMPPLCRAAAPDPARALPPRALLDDFLGAVVDAAVRQMGDEERDQRPKTKGQGPKTKDQGPNATDTTDLTITRGRPRRTQSSALSAQDSALTTHDSALSARRSPAAAWLAALTGPDPELTIGGPEADALFKAWQAWAGQSQVAGDDAFRITFRLEPPLRQDGPWHLAFLLRATDDPSLIVPAERIWRERGGALSYLHRRFEHPQERLLAGLGYAARIFPPIEAALRTKAPDAAVLTARQAFDFLSDAAPLLEQSGFGIVVPAWWRGGSARIRARAKASTKSPGSSGKSLLSFDSLVSFDWQLTLAGEPIDRAEFERLAALKQPLVQVRGQWVVLDPAQIQQALRLFERGPAAEMTLLDALRLGVGGEGTAALPGVEVEGVQAEGWLRDLLDRLNDGARLDILRPPKGLDAELRPYQQRGYSWLAFLRGFRLGACLADDMGLGKTLMSITYLLHERERLGATAPALVVCPTSVVGNWQRELQRFAPKLRVLAHRGADRLSGPGFIRAAKRHDVVLTSYPLLARDRETVTGLRWSTVVLDEAQNIKNPATRQAQAARALQSEGRVALTGTPVENRLSELWSIMAFLNPGYLGSEEAFRRQFARPIERAADKEAAERLRRLTAPFVLRRVKTDKSIISDLPDKLEMKVFCPLTPEQATLYEAAVRDALAQIESAEGDPMARRGQVLAMLMQLKQVCNHPAQFLKDNSALPGRSGKLARLTEMLEEVYAAGDRALVFTQFAEMGAMLQRHLRETFYEEALFLHGGTPPKDRDGMVRRFQAPSGPRVFILSLKAGGVGLNLTAASHVFHFDRWWNPAVENQATDRAFRIGQNRNVQVHKFVCQGTLEEKIDALIESKRALAESVLGTGEGWLTELDTAELRELVALRRDEAVEV